MNQVLPGSGFFGPQHRALAPELPYWEILDGVMWLADGRLEVGLQLSLPSLTFESEAALAQLMHGVRGLLRNGVAENQRMRVVAEATTPSAQALEPYQRSLAVENRALSLLHQSQCQLLQNDRKERLVHWNLYASVTLGRPTPRYTSRSPQDPLLSKAQRLRAALVAQANFAGFKARGLSGQEIFELCFRYFNPGQQNTLLAPYQPTWQRFSPQQMQRYQHLAPPTLRDSLLKSAIHNTALDYLQVGGHFVGILSLASTPNSTHFNMVQRLLQSHHRAFFVADFFHEPQDKALRKLKDTARMADAAASSSEIYVDSDQQQAAEEAERMAYDTRKSGQHHFKVAASLVLLSPHLEELRERMAQALSASSQIDGAPFKPLSYGLFVPYKRLAPFSGALFPKHIAVLEANAADFFPLPAPWQSHHAPVAVFETRWGNLVAFDPFHPLVPNYNGLVVGGSGSGKSATVQRLIKEFLKQPGHQVFVVEPKSTYSHFTQLLGGTVFAFDPSGPHRINPFDLPLGHTMPSPQKLANLIQILRAMLGPSLPQHLSLENALLAQALRVAYAAQKQTLLQADGSQHTEFSPPTLSQLTHALRTLDMLDHNPLADEEKRLAKELSKRLEPWTKQNPAGRILDGLTNLDLERNLVFFDTSRLGAYPGLEAVATLILSELIYNRTESKTQPTLVFLDEVWKLLAVPEAAALVAELYRLARARNMGVWAITQSLQDFGHEAAQSILTNTTHHLLLPTPGEEELMVKLLRLPSESQKLLELHRVSNVFTEALLFVRQEGRLSGDIVRIRLSPLERWLYSSSPFDVEQRQRILNRPDPLAALQKLAEENP